MVCPQLMAPGCEQHFINKALSLTKPSRSPESSAGIPEYLIHVGVAHLHQQWTPSFGFRHFLAGSTRPQASYQLHGFMVTHEISFYWSHNPPPAIMNPTTSFLGPLGPFRTMHPFIPGPTEARLKGSQSNRGIFCPDSKHQR